MTLNSLMNIMLPSIEEELQRVVSRLDKPLTHSFHEMLTYHMGWSGEGAGSEATGKRIRPLLVLLSCGACGADWKRGLPAAACIELIHNFSLAHDDIQDGSDLRRGRLTVWKKWGMAQAINVGDAFFILANQTVLDTGREFSAETALQVGKIIYDACLALSSGQFLDISYESQTDLTIEDYWPMISGKTAALISACTQVGSMLGGASESTQEVYRNFGHYLGLAFQMQDDYLGIWGDSALTGKSTDSDLVAGKKTLPVLYGLAKNGHFAQRWNDGPIQISEVQSLSEELAGEGAKLYTQEAVDRMTDQALKFLRAAETTYEAWDALYDLANKLLNRQA